MKKPRTSDFDPKFKEHRLKSSLADFPVIEKPTPVQPESGASDQGTDVPEYQGTRVPSESATDTRRKIKKRHPFDIYIDQIDALKKLSIEEQVQGGIGSMSAMVREAIDDYLIKIRAK